MKLPDIILLAINEIGDVFCPTCGHDITPQVTLAQVKRWLRKIVICRVDCGVYNCYHCTPHIREDYCKNGCFEGDCREITSFTLTAYTGD